VKIFSALRAEGSPTTALGSRRTTTKLFPTGLHVIYTPSVFLDPTLLGAMCGHGRIQTWHRKHVLQWTSKSGSVILTFIHPDLN